MEEEGGGIFSLLALAVVAPIEAWQVHAQKRRLLSPHELNLRRATRPLGVLALVAWGVGQSGARNIGDALRPVLLHPSENWVLAVLLGAVSLYGLASFITGARRCWGMRSDRMLPVWAFFELALGVAGFLWLSKLDLALALDVDPEMAMALRLLLVAASIWCAVVGGARLVLLTVGGGSALDEMTGVIAKKNAPMIAAQRRRPWWKI